MANSYKNAAVVLSSTGSTNLYTCPDATRAIVQSVNVANIDGSDRYITITWYDASSGSSYTLLNNALIPSGTAMNTIDAAVVLEAGDIIRCQAVTANTLHVTASILEQDPTSAFPEQSVTTTKIANNAVTSAKMATGVSPTIICTSSTRPSSPFAGQQIYETDTSKSLIYSGSVWQPPWNTAWGSVAAPATWAGNSITSTSTADTTLASVTFVAVAGRRYRTSWIFDTYCGAGYGVNVKVKNGATLIASVAYVGGVPAHANANLDGSYVISGISAGSCTINLTGNSSTATLTYYGSIVAGQFAIEDVGPA